MLRTETLTCCPICGDTNLRRVLVAADHESHTGDYGIDECAGCGVALTNPRPIESELPKLYEARSTSDFPHATGFVQRLRDSAIDRYLSSQLSTEPKRGAEFHALDFGCGDGALTRGLLRLGSSRDCAMRITAVDFHSSAPPALSGANEAARYMAHGDWEANSECYDAIFLRHVLEHHSFPLALLTRFKARLRPGGCIFIEVPNRRSIWARVFGSHYFAWYVPRHLFHFDESSLRGLLQRAELARVDVRQAHTPLIGRSIGYLTGSGMGNTGLLGLVTYPVQVLADAAARRSTTLRASAFLDS